MREVVKGSHEYRAIVSMSKEQAFQELCRLYWEIEEQFDDEYSISYEELVEEMKEGLKDYSTRNLLVGRLLNDWGQYTDEIQALKEGRSLWAVRDREEWRKQDAAEEVVDD